jgi:hypothetical protein
MKPLTIVIALVRLERESLLVELGAGPAGSRSQVALNLSRVLLRNYLDGAPDR